VPMSIAGNKCDLESERQVSQEDISYLAKKWSVPFRETSALARINVEAVFFDAVREVRRPGPGNPGPPRPVPTKMMGVSSGRCLLI